MPEWLRKFNPDANEKPNLKEVLNSRVVFYPACYDDGFMVEVFNPSHSAYVYLYADYAMTKEEWIEILHTRKLNKKNQTVTSFAKPRMETSEDILSWIIMIILLTKLFHPKNGLLTLNIRTVHGMEKDFAGCQFLNARKRIMKVMGQSALPFCI